MSNKCQQPVLLMVLFALASGCVSTDFGKTQASQYKSFLSRGSDPRKFWFSVYNGPSGPVLANSHRLHPEQATRLDFRKTRTPGVPIIDVKGRSDSVFAALIDTSSAYSWVQFETARELRLSPLNSPMYMRRTEHIQELFSGRICVASKLRLQQLHVENALLCVIDPTRNALTLQRGIERPNPTVILGMELLRGFSFMQIDYASQAVIFATTTPYEPNSDRLLSQVLLGEAHGALACKAKLNGREQTVILDSAGDYYVAAANPDSEELRHLELGDLVFRRLPLSDLAEYELGLREYLHIGRKILQKYTITIDNQKRLLCFERPLQ